MSVTDKAVAAAVRAYISSSRPVGLAEIEAILEAAGPHMLADAWDRGHSAGDGDCTVMWDADKAGRAVEYRDIATRNPYRPAA